VIPATVAPWVCRRATGVKTAATIPRVPAESPLPHLVPSGQGISSVPLRLGDMEDSVTLKGIIPWHSISSDASPAVGRRRSMALLWAITPYVNKMLTAFFPVNTL